MKSQETGDGRPETVNKEQLSVIKKGNTEFHIRYHFLLKLWRLKKAVVHKRVGERGRVHLRQGFGGLKRKKAEGRTSQF